MGEHNEGARGFDSNESTREESLLESLLRSGLISEEESRSGGMSLAQLLGRSGYLPSGTALRWIQEVGRLLVELHASGKVHGAVDMEVIQIASGGQVYLENPPSFLEFEVEGERRDRFALAVVLYRSLTGVDPLGGVPVKEWRGAEDWKPMPPSRLCDEVGVEVDELALECLDPDRGAKSIDCSEMVARITQILGDYSVTSKTDTVFEFEPGDSSDAVAGEGFSHYLELEEIGRGGMGVVYRGVDPDLDRPVAIKVFPAGVDLVGSQGHQRFLREARILARLDHPNIVPVHELGTTPEGAPYYVMKLIQGRSLKEALDSLVDLRVDSPEAFPLERLLRDYSKICEAIAFSHSRSVIHRDLKPANVMIGEYGEVLVVDWGLGKILGETEESWSSTGSGLSRGGGMDVTLDGMVMGTPTYMAPEQALGAQDHVDERSDVYSLGSILHTILYGHPPVTGESREEIVRNVARGELGAMGDAVSGRVPRELAAVVDRALRFQPKERYASAGALRDDIEAFLEGRTLSVVTYSPWALLRKWYRRNRRVCAVAVSLILISGFVFGGYVWKNRMEQYARFLDHLNAAQTQIESFDSKMLATLEKKRPVIEPETGREYEESGSARDRRREVIRAHLVAANALDRALQIRPAHAEALALRILVGERVGRIALGGAEYLLARQAYVDLAPLGVENKGWSDQVDAARQERQLWRKGRIETILADIREGLARNHRPPGAPGMDEYIQETLSYRDRQTVELLSGALDGLIAKADRGGLQPKATWTRSDRDIAHYVSQVLGGLGWPECVGPLARWLEVIEDPDLVQKTAFALCRTRVQSAREPLMRLRERIGSNDPSWVSIRRVLGQLPGGDEEEKELGLTSLRERALTRKQRRDFRGALEDYDRALNIEPDHVSTRINRALVHMELGNYDEALLDLDDSLQREPGRLEALINRGLVRHSLNEHSKALEDFSEALERDPSSSMARVNRSLVWRDLGQIDRALEDLSQAIEIEPQRVEAWINRGILRSHQGRFREAFRDMNEAIRLDPTQVHAWSERGWIQAYLGNTKRGLEDLEEAIRIDPRKASLYERRARILIQVNRLEEALSALTVGFQLEPERASLWEARGRVRLGQRDLESALRDFDRALELSPGYPEALEGRARTLVHTNDFEAALAVLDRCLEMDPDLINALHLKGSVFLWTRRVPEALACFDRVLEIDANHVDARIGRAKVSISLQKSGEAIEDLLRVQKIQPEHPELLLLLGIAYRFEKRFDRAHELIVGYLQRNPESSHGYFEKGLNESNSKRAKEARDSFTRAIEYSKGNSQWRILSHRHRAKAWRTLGETNREKEDLNAYLRLLPEARDRGEVEARLAELAGD